MSLFEALSLLAQVHTREANPHHEVFLVHMGASPQPEFSVVDYTRAWNQVRHAIGAPSFKDN